MWILPACPTNIHLLGLTRFRFNSKRLFHMEVSVLANFVNLAASFLTLPPSPPNESFDRLPLLSASLSEPLSSPSHLAPSYTFTIAAR
jgi:hypothetical protein